MNTIRIMAFVTLLSCGMGTLAQTLINPRAIRSVLTERPSPGRPVIQRVICQGDSTRVEFSGINSFDVIQIQRLNGGVPDGKTLVNPSALSRQQVAGQVEVFIWIDANTLPGVAYSYRLRVVTGSSKGPWSLEATITPKP